MHKNIRTTQPKLTTSSAFVEAKIIVTLVVACRKPKVFLFMCLDIHCPMGKNKAKSVKYKIHAVMKM